MTETYTSTLDSFLVDSSDPRWSSNAINRLFSSMTGNTKEKLQLLLPYIDERFAGSKHALTETQSNFLRDITIVNHYSDNESPYSLDDLDWLMVRFQANPLPQRALLIVFLVSTDELPRDAAAQIRAVLAGTPGEKWLAD